MIRIRKIETGKRDYLPMLLLGDEQENMIDRYLDRGELWVLFERRNPVAVAVVTDRGEGVLELNNIAVSPDFRRRGYGSRLLGFLEERYRDRAHTLLVGTGETPATLDFYARCGFVFSHRIAGFFTELYDHPIVEAGILLSDMVYLRKSLR